MILIFYLKRKNNPDCRDSYYSTKWFLSIIYVFININKITEFFIFS